MSKSQLIPLFQFNEADLTTVATYMRNLEASFTSDDIAIGSIDVMTDVKKGPSVDPRFHGMDQFWLIVVVSPQHLPSLWPCMSVHFIVTLAASFD